MTLDFEPYCSKCRDVEPIAKILDMLSFCEFENRILNKLLFIVDRLGC